MSDPLSRHGAGPISAGPTDAGRTDAGPSDAASSGAASDADRAAALLQAHRASIDRLDAILIYTLAERFKHTQQVGALKKAHALPPADPAREATQIARLQRLAEEADLDPGFAREFLRFVIDEVIRHHKKFHE